MGGAWDWALLAAGAFAASLLAAVTGFGSAAVLLPLMAAVCGVREAVPALAVAQLLANLSRAYFNRREVVWPVVGWFSLGAVPAALAGGALFAATPDRALGRSLSVLLLALVAWRRLRPGPARRLPPPGSPRSGPGAACCQPCWGPPGRCWPRSSSPPG